MRLIRIDYRNGRSPSLTVVLRLHCALLLEDDCELRVFKDRGHASPQADVGLEKTGLDQRAALQSAAQAKLLLDHYLLAPRPLPFVHSAVGL
jgi:hypothetical protein